MALIKIIWTDPILRKLAFILISEHYQDTGGLMPLMDLVEDITFEKLLGWFLNEFNNSVAAYDWEDAGNCLHNWETVRAFLVKAEQKVDDNYNWEYFQTNCNRHRN